MAIVGLGTDIVEIARIESVLERTGDSLAKRILTETELANINSNQSQLVFSKTLCS